MRVFAVPIAALVWCIGSAGVAETRPRVLSLDQCADQYVVALAPDAELFLSPRADDPDSWVATEARRRPRVRPTLEAAIGADPQVVVRYWGGEPRLLQALAARDVTVVTIEDATDMQGVRDNISRVAKALDREPAGRRMIARMDARLARALRPATPGRTAQYLTSGGFTAGSGTLMDAILKAAGYVNAAGIVGFGPLSVERIALRTPRRFVMGFFDQARADWRGAGRHPVVKRASRGRVVADLPAAMLTCPAWFAADAALAISGASMDSGS